MLFPTKKNLLVDMAPFSPEFNMAAHVFVLTDSILSVISQGITLSSDRLDENTSINPYCVILGH